MLRKINKLIVPMVKSSEAMDCIHRWMWWRYRDVRNFALYGVHDFPTDFNIETTTYCNRRCWFCPNSKYERGRLENERLMDKSLFYKIIDELASYDFVGRIGPHFYGEPLFDDRIVDFVRYIRDRLPYCKININTNGDLLDVDYYIRLVQAGVNQFIIGNYDNYTSDSLNRLFGFLDAHPESKVNISYKPFNRDTPRSTRGGEIKVKNVERPRCLSPLNPVVIDVDGNVVLCCNDYHSSYKFGNVKQQSIIEIWNSPIYRMIREELHKRIYRLPICKKCNGG